MTVMTGPISGEIDAYVHELRWILDEVARLLEDLPLTALNWRPRAGQANTAYAIASHLASCTRVYVLGFGCGQQVTRDREAEFAAQADEATELIAVIRRLSQDIERDLRALPPSSLDRRLLPAQELWGTGKVREISGREAIVESIRHAAIHLGELRLTKDLQRAEAKHASR